MCPLCLNVLDSIIPILDFKRPSDQPSSSGRKGPTFANSPIGKLGEFRPRKRTRSPLIAADPE